MVMLMLHKFCVSLAKRTSSDGDIDTQEVVAYGWEILLSTTGNLTVLILLSCLLGCLSQMIVFILCYSAIRSCTGGRHARNHIFCLAEYGAGAFGGILAAEFVAPAALYYTAATGILSLIIVWIFAPYEHPNRPLSNTFKRQLKKRSRIAMSVGAPAVCLLSLISPLYGCVAGTAIFFEVLTTINSQRRKNNEQSN